MFDTYARPSHNSEVADLLAEREETLRTLKLRIRRAQQSMVEFANRKRRDVEFKVGDSVLLKLQPYRQKSVGRPLSNKLSRRYYGPYVILERIGEVAYRLQLPADSRIHDVFHVSLLKAFVPHKSVGVELPPEFSRSRPLDTPIEATQKRTVLVDRIPQAQWLVRWSSDAGLAPSWEPKELLRSHFPNLRLENKVVSKRGGVDTTLITNAASDDERQLHEPMQLGNSGLSDDGKSAPRGRAKNRVVKKDRPRREAPRPARYRDYDCS